MRSKLHSHALWGGDFELEIGLFSVVDENLAGRFPDKDEHGCADEEDLPPQYLGRVHHGFKSMSRDCSPQDRISAVHVAGHGSVGIGRLLAGSLVRARALRTETVLCDAIPRNPPNRSGTKWRRPWGRRLSAPCEDKQARDVLVAGTYSGYISGYTGGAHDECPPKASSEEIS